MVTDIYETGSEEEKAMLRYYHLTADYLKNVQKKKAAEASEA